MLSIVTIGLSAFILFLIQPMISKIILPVFGGGSSIWLTALVFFQTMLLAGYASSHFIAKRCRPLQQVGLYLAMLFLAVFIWPVHVRIAGDAMLPTLRLLLILLLSIGLPYFILASTSPTIQYWMAFGERRLSRNPYVLYAVSNAGSLAGLLSYPFLVEPHLTVDQQLTLWVWGFGAYAALMLACAWAYLRVWRSSQKPEVEKAAIQDARDPEAIQIPMRTRLGWIVQAMIPAAGLMVFTHHLIVDIVNFPLLWVVPLCLYLLSFVFCFLWPAISEPRPLRTLITLLLIGALAITMRGEFNVPFVWQIVGACCGLMGICMFFHGNLERAKPQAQDLTGFYLAMSLGGSLGGIFVAIIAPVIFKSHYELYLVLIAALYFILHPYLVSGKPAVRRIAGSVVLIMLALTYYNAEIALLGQLSYKARSFYGTYTIREEPAVPQKQVAGRILSQGTTTHGGQAWDSKGRLIPISYYHPRSGVGQALRRLPDIEHIGVVGLGTGVVALYGRAHQRFDFFEIDPLVVDIAQNRFDNLKRSRARIHHHIGDARITLRSIDDHQYDVLIMDAFTSGSIPVHLLTQEAMQEFLRVLRPDGIILYHISNRFIDLLPVLNGVARELDLTGRHHRAAENKALHQSYAHWVALSPDPNALRRLTAGDANWRPLPEDAIRWTDQFSHLWSVVDFAREY